MCTASVSSQTYRSVLQGYDVFFGPKLNNPLYSSGEPSADPLTAVPSVRDAKESEVRHNPTASHLRGSIWHRCGSLWRSSGSNKPANKPELDVEWSKTLFYGIGLIWRNIKANPSRRSFDGEQVCVSGIPKRFAPHVLEDAKSLKIGIARQFQALYLCKKLKTDIVRYKCKCWKRT